MKAKILGILSICLLALVNTSCEDGQNFPDEPHLEYRSYTLVNGEDDPDFPLDHALVDLYFTDGDGDIGLDSPDSTQFNFWVDIFEKWDTGYVYAYSVNAVLKDLADPGQQNKVLEGIISYKVNLADALTDTVKVDFELIDDAGHSSGVVTSEPIWVDF